MFLALQSTHSTETVHKWFRKQGANHNEGCKEAQNFKTITEKSIHTFPSALSVNVFVLGGRVGGRGVFRIKLEAAVISTIV